MGNLGSQFALTASPVESRTAPKTFLATDRADEAAGTVAYRPPMEEPAFRHIQSPFDGAGRLGGIEQIGRMAYPPATDGPHQQGSLFYGSPAKVDVLAVASEHRGRGLGMTLAEAAVDEHQSRFGNHSFPLPSEALSADSAPMVSHLTGRSHAQAWGSGMPDDDDEYDDAEYDSGSRREDRFADDALEDASDRAYLADRRGTPWESVPQPSGAIRRAMGSRMKSPGEQFAQVPGQEKMPW